MALQRLFDEAASGGTTGTVAETQPEASAAALSTDNSTIQSTGESDATLLSSGAQPNGAASTSTVPAPAAQTLFDRIRNSHQIDFGGKYKTEDELVTGLVHAARLVGQRNQDAEIGRLYSQHSAEFQEYLQRRQQQMQGQPPVQARVQQAASPQQQAAAGYWAPPEWPANWDAYLDATTGAPIENAPLEVRTAYQKRKDFYDSHRHELVFNFPKAIRPALDEMRQSVIQEVEQRYAQREQQAKLAAEADMLRNQHASWIYLNDAQGRSLTDVEGRRLLSPAGQYFVGYLGEANQIGIQSQQHAVQYAILRTQQALGLQQQAPSAAPQLPAGAVHSPNTNAGRAPSAKPVSALAGLSLRERLERNLASIPDDKLSPARSVA